MFQPSSRGGYGKAMAIVVILECAACQMCQRTWPPQPPMQMATKNETQKAPPLDSQTINAKQLTEECWLSCQGAIAALGKECWQSCQGAIAVLEESLTRQAEGQAMHMHTFNQPETYPKCVEGNGNNNSLEGLERKAAMANAEHVRVGQEMHMNMVKANNHSLECKGALASAEHACEGQVMHMDMANLAEELLQPPVMGKEYKVALANAEHACEGQKMHRNMANLAEVEDQEVNLDGARLADRPKAEEDNKRIAWADVKHACEGQKMHVNGACLANRPKTEEDNKRWGCKGALADAEHDCGEGQEAHVDGACLADRPRAEEAKTEQEVYVDGECLADRPKAVTGAEHIYEDQKVGLTDHPKTEEENDDDEQSGEDEKYDIQEKLAEIKRAEYLLMLARRRGPSG